MPEKTRVEITETSEPPAKAGFQADLQDRKLMRVYLERTEVKFNGDSDVTGDFCRGLGINLLWDELGHYFV